MGSPRSSSAIGSSGLTCGGALAGRGWITLCKTDFLDIGRRTEPNLFEYKIRDNAQQGESFLMPHLLAFCLAVMAAQLRDKARAWQPLNLVAQQLSRPAQRPFPMVRIAPHDGCGAIQLLQRRRPARVRAAR